MQNKIKFDGVLDHLDILSEESRVCEQLKKILQLAMEETLDDEEVRRMQLRKIIQKVDTLHRNINGREKLLLEIVSILKSAKIKSDEIVSENGLIIKKIDGIGNK